MRNRSRELCRDAAFAKRAKEICQNNIIGTGIGMQARVMTTRDELNEPVNDEIEAEWKEWCAADQCHTGQSLAFQDLERLLVGQAFEGGEILVRKHYFKVGSSRVPLALEVIEPERLADEYTPLDAAGNLVGELRMGVEVDPVFGAPLAYWLRERHPGDLKFPGRGTEQIERVPARDIIHVRSITRWPQTRGTPWMHAAGRKFNDIDGLTEAEITAARAAACYMGFIEPPAAQIDDPFPGEEEMDGEQQLAMDPAMVVKLRAGEKFNFAAPNRPNVNMDAFVRLMLREVAAGAGTTYESLSRDYSQSNYSSSRLAVLDDRDLWRAMQQWYVRQVRVGLHRIWLQQAIFARAIRKITPEAFGLDPVKWSDARFKPRGWSWIDPTKEVAAYKDAIRCGFTTVSRVIEQTADGLDLEDVLKERARELELMASYGLEFETDPTNDPEMLKADAAMTAAKHPATPAGPADGGDGDEGTDEAADRLMVEFNRNGRTYAYRGGRSRR